MKQMKVMKITENQSDFFRLFFNVTSKSDDPEERRFPHTYVRNKYLM
jgi:hypothetical protein